MRVVEGTLRATGFRVARMKFKGSCFDLVASRIFTLLFIKVLQNIDSISVEQAEDLKRLSKFFRATPLVVGIKTKNEELEDGVVYERFGIYAINPATLYDMLVENELPAIFAERGGFYVNIDGELLRALREERGYSLGELANLLGVSRKSLQNYERGKSAVSLEVAVRLEQIFDAPMARPIDVLSARVEANLDSKPETPLEREIFERLQELGMGVIKVKRAPFNAVSKEDEFRILTGIEAKKTPTTVKKARMVDEVSRIINSDGVFILERTRTEVVGEIPLIPKETLREIRDADELIEVIEDLKRQVKKKLLQK